MSSNDNHIISLHNYEEWFVLYMDDELDAAQQKMVEAFVLLHPHLQEELDLLLSTKLPVDDVHFSGKEELMAASMKLNSVDESLLLYIDNELPPEQRRAVEAKMAVDTDIRRQIDILQKTKLDAAETIPYPDKTELYRHTERRIMPVWMRIAAAVMILLTGGWLFQAQQDPAVDAPGAVVQVEQPASQPSQGIASGFDTKKTENKIEENDANAPAIAIVAPAERRNTAGTAPAVPKATKTVKAEVPMSAEPAGDAVAAQPIEALKVDLSKLSTAPVMALNKSVTNLAVTSDTPGTYNPSDNPEEPIVTEGDDKPNRTPAKGFLRKVSRFIERRTGIGTVNADNELLVGSIALKLN